MSPEVYFANLEGEYLTAALLDRVKRYQQHILTSGYFALGVKSVQFVHGMDAKGYSSFELRRRGPRGEHTGIKVPHYASLYNNFISQLTGQRLVFDPKPEDTDWRASEQARRAKGVLQDELSQGLEDTLLDTVDHSVQMGMGWTALDFDPNGGPPALPDPDTGEPIPAGVLKYRSYMPQDCAFDIEARSPREVKWTIGRQWEDAHDLIAQLPEKATEILAARGPSNLEREVEIQDATLMGTATDPSLRRRVPLYVFRHDATPACPNGRIAWFLRSGKLLFADDLPFMDAAGQVRTCVRPLAMRWIKGTAFGFSPVWLLLALQEAKDMLASIEITNYRAHGVGLILNPRGSDITPRKIAAGLSVIEHTPNLEPKLANFTAQPSDIAGAQERTVNEMQQLVGVSAIDRGDPPASLKSGSALLFVKATTAQNMKPYLEKASKHHEGVGEDYLFLFTQFVRSARPIRVDGELSERTEFVSGEDLGGVSKVRLEVGNPLTHSLAGQVQIASDLLTQQAITANEYLEIVIGGGLDKILKRSTSQRILVEQENGWLREGQAPLVAPTDNHPYHMAHHAIELNSQQARQNPAIRQAVLQHLSQHQQAWSVATLQNPGLLEALGIPPMQAALGMAMGPPAGPGAAPAAPDAQGAMDAPPDDGQMPKPPRLPPGSAAATGVNPNAPGPGGAQ